MTPEQIVYLAFLAFGALVALCMMAALFIGIGRYLGSREDHEAARMAGYAAGRRDERYEAARDPLMPRGWAERLPDEAVYPPMTIREAGEGGSER